MLDLSAHARRRGSTRDPRARGSRAARPGATSMRRPRPRPRDARRPHLGHGRRRPDPEWRDRLAPQPLGLCIDNLVSADVVTADGRWSMPSAERARRPAVGAQGRWRQLRRRHRLRVRAPPGRADGVLLRPGLPDRRRQRPDPRLARLHGRQGRSRRIAHRVLDDPEDPGYPEAAGAGGSTRSRPCSPAMPTRARRCCSPARAGRAGDRLLRARCPTSRSSSCSTPSSRSASTAATGRATT